MASLLELISVSDTAVKNTMYDYLLYSYPEQPFWDKVIEMEQAWNVPVREVLRDELFLRGIIIDRSDVCRIGPRMRKKIKQFLFDHPMPVPEWEVTNHSLRNRQIDGLAKLKAYGEKHDYLILFYDPDSALLMWDKRKSGILLNTGRSFAYVYQGGRSYSFNMDLSMIGYFQLSSANVVSKFKEAINGHMEDRTAALSERRKQFIIRRKKRWTKFNSKRNAIKKGEAAGT